ncbi:MAG: FUSC family protein [Burkholderiales bacterium]|nr:FUSC family protein [Burkholderiales bacterium]
MAQNSGTTSSPASTGGSLSNPSQSTTASTSALAAADAKVARLLAKLKKDGPEVLKKPTNLALDGAAFRFFLAISACLCLSLIFDDQRIGGFACVACFMVLLSDTKSNLWGRLFGCFIVLVVVSAAVLAGYLVKDLAYGKWLVIAVACFGVSLLPFVENFWWLVGKYFLIFLMISLYDFAPDAAALEGYGLGFLVAVGVIIIDTLMWKITRLGVRPMDQIKRFIGGVRNPRSFAVISAIILLFALWTALAVGFQEPAWVGITVIYLMNTKISVGVKKSLEKVAGTAIGYAIVVFIFAFPVSYHLYILGPLIVLMGTPIPVFIAKNYLLSQVCVTAYILLVLEWLTKSYGGDASLLGWRLLDTCWGAACALVGFLIMALIDYIQRKRDERRYRKAEKEAEELKVLNQRLAEQERIRDEHLKATTNPAHP